MYLLVAAMAIGFSADYAPTNKNINWNDLFPRTPWTGKAPRGMEWSHDDRYLAYIWNPYDEPYTDLWLYDTKEHRSIRLTSPDVMKAFDPKVPEALVTLQSQRAEREKVLKMTDDEYRQFQIDQRKKQGQPDRRETYQGPSEFSWSNKGDELLIGYKGDIFRWKIGDKKPTRLTQTKDAETQMKFTKDDSGFYFGRGGGVYKMSFTSPMVQQINPDLPDGLQLGGYILSPDESRMFVVGIKQGRDGGRTIDYLSYRERFAKAMKAPRAVADDPFTGETHYFIYDVGDDAKADAKPYECFVDKGGDDLIVTGTNEKGWSPDSKSFVYSKYSRNTKDFEVYGVDAIAKTTKAIYKTKTEGEENTPGMADPFYLASGKVVVLTEASGFRHPWLIDPTLGSARQITSGDFETYPISASEDGKTLFVRSAKESPARHQIYAVNIDSGNMTKLSSKQGFYRSPQMSHSGKFAAGMFASFEQRGELNVIDTSRRGSEAIITSSHKKGFEAANKLIPEIVTYKNRSGQTIYAYVFVPPGMKKGEKRPLMVYVYGGPLGESHSVEDGQFNSTAYLFNEYLTLEMGYITVTIDPRGQSGYGAAFGRANFDRPGVAQVEDLSDGVKFLDEKYGVDKNRVAVNGWSFGGFQTQMCMYTAPDVFTLGIAGAGPTEWQNYNNWYTGNTITRTPVGKPEVTDKYSLTKLAKNLKNPLLLLHGMEDTNVLFQDTVKVYQELLHWGKGPLVELALDPTGGHGMGGDMNTSDRHLIYLAFLKKHWGSDWKNVLP